MPKKGGDFLFFFQKNKKTIFVLMRFAQNLLFKSIYQISLTHKIIHYDTIRKIPCQIWLKG